MTQLSILRAAATTIRHNLFACRCTRAFTQRRRRRRRLLYRRPHVAGERGEYPRRRFPPPRGGRGKRIARQIPQIAGARATQLCDVMSDVAAIYPKGGRRRGGEALPRRQQSFNQGVS